MAADQGAGFETHRKRTRRDEFLDTMNAIVPWAELCAVVEPHYPKRGNGRPPIGLERMLRIHFIQHWFNLADFACEQALYDSASLRRFVGVDLGCEAVPDATGFRRGTNVDLQPIARTALGSRRSAATEPGEVAQEHRRSSGCLARVGEAQHQRCCSSMPATSRIVWSNMIGR